MECTFTISSAKLVGVPFIEDDSAIPAHVYKFDFTIRCIYLVEDTTSSDIHKNAISHFLSRFQQKCLLKVERDFPNLNIMFYEGGVQQPYDYTWANSKPYFFHILLGTL